MKSMEKQIGIVTEIKSLIDAGKYTQSAIAKSIDVSATTLSQFLAGNYPGKKEPIVNALESFLNNHRDRENLKSFKVSFIKSSFSERVIEGAKICQIENEIGVCVGSAGMGKTESVREFIRKNPNDILIEVDPAITAKSLFQELVKKTGAPDSPTNLHDMFESCVEKLKGTGRLIILDEAENLSYKALELIRRLHDKAGVGVFLVGLPRLISNLRGKKGEYAQLYSRVSLLIHLDNYKSELLREQPEIIQDDAMNFIHHFIPNCNGNWKEIYERVGFNARVLVKVAKRINRMSEVNGDRINSEIIKRAFQSLII